MSAVAHFAVTFLAAVLGSFLAVLAFLWLMDLGKARQERENKG